jgi:hypothetical protein
MNTIKSELKKKMNEKQPKESPRTLRIFDYAVWAN